MLSSPLPRSFLPTFRALAWVLLAGVALSLRANIPGGGTGAGANVTLVDSGSTVTMSNGVVSILIAKSSAKITRIDYTFNNTGASQTLNLLSGGNNGGMLYWEHSNNQGLVFSGYTLVADPATTGGDYAEVSLYSTTQANMPMEIHYSMRRGSPGFYVTPIFIHDAALGAFGVGECRDNIYAGSIFNWMSVDATRNKLMQVGGGTTAGVPNAPVECSLWTSGLYQGRYEDKYKYSAALGEQRVWGWSSVTANGMSGKNVGLWNVLASAEYYNGGPLKPELMCHMGTTILNMINGGHYGMGGDGAFVLGETWSKAFGPYFIYCNNVSGSVTDPLQASQSLYNDAVAQAAAEASAWPYSWFDSPHYSGPAARGSVTGRIVINDAYNPGASAANLWVGLIRQPVTSSGTYDFQQWMKPLQFWVRSDADGSFTLPAVPAGANYTLYAFGPGAPGTFMSQPQTGGNPPFLADYPAAPFAVSVAAGAATALGDVAWTPARLGPTVFEIGYPDRTSRKFRHGDDYWVGDIGPTPSTPSPVWSKWLEFPYDFPDGLNYVVGSSRWSTDWNFVQPVVLNASGGWNNSSSTITFNLPSAPASGAQARLHLGLASDYYAAIIVNVNGVNLGGGSGPISGVTATPSNLVSTGFIPSSSRSDSSIREYSNGAFSDERITLPGSLLKAGANTITFSIRQVGGSYFADHAMYDYIRLELTGYVPPAPASVSAFPGDNRTLVTWPVTPGATGYKVLRGTASGGGYVTIAANAPGPVCGGGLTHAAYVDATAANGATYYYVVQSLNPAGSSANSPESAGVAPSASAATSIPSAPTGLVASASHRSVTLRWTAPAGARLYTVRRTILVDNGVGSYTSLATIPLANGIASTSYTDTSPTDGTRYSYTVSAANDVGESPVSAAAIALPLASVPTSAPLNLAITPGAGQITLSWSALSDAVGYIVQRSTLRGGPYAYLGTLSSQTYVDSGLPDNTTYHYVVSAMNSGGVGVGSEEVSATTAPGPPANVSAIAGNTQVSLTWTASAGATGYVVSRATVSGGPYTTVGTAAGTAFTNGGLVNGTAYHYVVAARNAAAIGLTSAEVAATPVSTVPVAPLNLTVTPGQAQVALSWSASSGATGYTIYRATSTGGPYSIVASGVTATNYTQTNVTGAGAYYYVVAATNAGGTGAYSAEALALFRNPSTLAWTGAASAVWGDAALNWTSPDGPAYFIAGDTVRFDDTSSVLAVTLSGTLEPAAVVVASAQNYAFSGSGLLAGAGTLTKSGAGTLTVSTANTFTGGVTLSAGTLVLGHASALGTGPVTLQGGILATGTLTPANAILIDGSATITGGSPGGTHGIKNVSGSGVLTLDATNVFDLEGSFSGYSGRVVLTGSGSFRFFGGSGSSSAAFDLGTRTLNARSGSAFTLGSLAGAAGSVLSGSSGSGNNAAVAYTVGANDLDSAFAGAIANGNAATSLVKTGSGALTLSGASTYTGSTAVSAGALYVTGTLGATAVSVSSGATFGGTGTLAGGLSLASGARLALGFGASATRGPTVSGAATLNGDVTVVPALLDGSLAPGTYPLLTYGGTLSGSPSFSWLDTTGSGYSATFDTATAGLVKITLVAPLSALESWRLSHFGDSSASGPAADDADPDLDGLPNLLEYALGSDPRNGGSFQLPSLQLSDGTLQLAFNRIADPALTYTVQGSSDLSSASWTDLWSSSGDSNLPGPISVSDTAPLSSFPKRFLRLRVSTP